MKEKKGGRGEDGKSVERREESVAEKRCVRRSNSAIW